jgi:hypothetical protein
MTMRRVLVLSALLVLIASPAFALQASLSWTNPADPSVTGINVQKAATAAGPFVNVNTTPLTPATNTFSDTTIALGAQVCYQVVWVNTLGTSTPLGPACGTPAAPLPGSGLTIIFKP